jgi:hypothetical protein
MLAGCGARKVAWQKVIDLGGDETVTALSCDGTSFYVSFVATKPGSSDRAGWFVTKLDKNGQERWTRMYKDSPHAVCEDIWADNQGHLLATGRTRVQDRQLCLVIRYALDGSLSWQKGLTVGDRTWGTGICPVSGNRIAVCGVAGTDANSDHMVALLDALDGKTIWARNYDICPADAAVRIAADSRDNLAIVGQHADKDTPANSNIIVIKLKPNGDTLWTRTYDSGGEDRAGDVAFDPFGNVLVTGTAVVGDSVRCVILEYDPDGRSIRKAAYGEQAQATGRAIFVTSEADIFIAGQLIGRKVGKGGIPEPTGEVLAFQYRPGALSVWERHYTPGPKAEGVDLLVKEEVYVAANVEGRTRDAMVCRFSLPKLTGQSPAGR